MKRHFPPLNRRKAGNVGLSAPTAQTRGVRAERRIGNHPAARPSSRRSTLKSIHWIDLPGFAGRVSPPPLLSRRQMRLGDVRIDVKAQARLVFDVEIAV